MSRIPAYHSSRKYENRSRGESSDTMCASATHRFGFRDGKNSSKCKSRSSQLGSYSRQQEGSRISRLQRFDRVVTAELDRRREPNTITTTATSDTHLLDAVDKLARAEAAHCFVGAVAAAEAAAASMRDPALAEEAAAAGARSFQAELVDVVAEDVPGLKPIQILGYVGITRPKYAVGR